MDKPSDPELPRPSQYILRAENIDGLEVPPYPPGRRQRSGVNNDFTPCTGCHNRISIPQIGLAGLGPGSQHITHSGEISAHKPHGHTPAQVLPRQRCP